MKKDLIAFIIAILLSFVFFATMTAKAALITTILVGLIIIAIA